MATETKSETRLDGLSTALGKERQDDPVAGQLVVIPIFPVRDLGEAMEYWSRVPGLTAEAYSNEYAFVRYGDAEVFHLDVVRELDPATNRAGCYIHAPGIDALRAQLVDVGLPASEARDEPWGMREFFVKDPSGNLVRLGCGNEHVDAGHGHADQ